MSSDLEELSMQSFSDWLKEKNLQENIADYTPGFIRKPLQSIGLMGKTTDEEDEAERRRYQRSPEYLRIKKAEIEDERREEEMMRKKHMDNYYAQGAEELRKKKEQEAREFKEKEARGLIYDPKTKKWRLPEIGQRKRQDWPYGG